MWIEDYLISPKYMVLCRPNIIIIIKIFFIMIRYGLDNTNILLGITFLYYECLTHVSSENYANTFFNKVSVLHTSVIIH